MSARDSAKSSVTNVNLQTRPSRSTSNCNQQRPPFIHSIFLVFVQNVDPCLISQSSFPALGKFNLFPIVNLPFAHSVDSIAHHGVTTAVMLTGATRELARYRNGVGLYMSVVARDKAQFDTRAVRMYEADHVYNLLRKPTLSEIRGIHFIQALDLSTADRIVSHLITVLAPFQGPERQPSAAAVGLLVTGDGDWSKLVKIPAHCGSGLVQTPRQSYEIGVDGTPNLGGVMCLAGKGIVRKDARESLAHCHGPGDGCLRLDQIVLEMLSKTELVLKFGA